MIDLERYMEDVRRAMRGMDAAVREDILRELKGHIEESMAANGGNVRASITAMGPAAVVGRRYRELYGYGRRYRWIFTAVAVVLAVPSVPVLIVGPDIIFPFAFSIPFLVGAAAWIVWVSVAAGSRAGLFAGLAGLIGRSAAFGVSSVLQAGASFTIEGLGLFIAASAILVVLGWIPGTARKAWSGPRPEI